MEAIYAKLQALKDFKDEIMDDLNDCMDDFDQRSERPPQFDQVVDIAIEDERAKAKEAVDREDDMMESAQLGEGLAPATNAYEGAMEKLGLAENEDKPFWAKYLKSGQEQLPDKPGIVEGVVAVFEGEKNVDDLLREQ